MIYRAINGLIRHAIEADLITDDDIFVVRNQLMDILKLTDWNDKEPLTGNIEELLEPLIDYAVKAEIIEDTSVQRIRPIIQRPKTSNPLLFYSEQRVNCYMQKSGSLAQGMNLSSCSGAGFSPSFGSSVSRCRR